MVATGLVVIVKVAVVALAATVTLAGTCAAEVLLLDSVTAAPPAGAGPFRVAVPVEEIPPTTELGVDVRVLKPGALTVMVVVFVVMVVVEVGGCWARVVGYWNAADVRVMSVYTM